LFSKGGKRIVKQLPVNRQIRAKEIRLIGEGGEQLGVVPVPRALQIARERDLDLVEVSPTATPPVCRLLDYGKYRYEQAKKERGTKRGQKVGLLKELRLSAKIEEHDLQAKIKTAKKLLEDGNRLRLVLRLRGRENVYPELGLKTLQKAAEALKEVAVGDHPVKQAKVITLTLSPIPGKKTKGVQEDAKA